MRAFTVALAAFVAIGLCPDVAVGDLHWKATLKKSLAIAQLECADYLRVNNDTLNGYIRAGYPNDPVVQKLLHCILVNLHAWDDWTGVKDNVMSTFFQPKAGDTCYQNRTQSCLSQNVSPIPLCDVFRRGYESFLCYYRNYGDAVDSPNFIAYDLVIRRQFFKQSMAIEDTPRAIVQEFAKRHIMDIPEFQPVLYTYLTRAGYYIPGQGWISPDISIEFNFTDILDGVFDKCQKVVQQQYCTEPELAYQIFKQCYYRHGNYTLDMIQLSSQEYLVSPPSICESCGFPGASPCSSCGSSTVVPAPCSTCGLPSPCKSCGSSGSGVQFSYNS